MVRTIPGPANMSSSVAVYPDFAEVSDQRTIAIAATSVRTIH